MSGNPQRTSTCAESYFPGFDFNFPWIKKLTFLLPYQENMPDARIGWMLTCRYLFACWMSFLTEYQLLAIFFLYQRFDAYCPLDMLHEILGLLLSLRTMGRMLVLDTHLLLYGTLMCHLHERLPTCHVWRWQRVKQELPIRLCLLAVLISLGCSSSWVYLQYMDELDETLDLNYTGRYLRLHGAFCGLAFFLTDHSFFAEEVWPLPIVRVGSATRKWLKGLHFQLLPSLRNALACTLLHACINWPNMNSDHWASCQLVGQSSCISAVIIIKLAAVKYLFGIIIHRKLSLTFQQPLPKHMQLPNYQPDYRLTVPVVLGISCQYYGFQQQMAREFYLMVSCKHKETQRLYSLAGNLSSKPKNWLPLRNVLLLRIKEFTRQLKRCRKPTKSRRRCPQLPPKRKFAGMRSLTAPPVKRRFWSRRCGDLQPPKKILCNSRQLTKTLLRKLDCWKLEQQAKDFWKNLCQAELFTQKSKKNCFELCEGRTLLWLVPAIARLCVRSRKEDKHFVLRLDLEKIFQSLHDLDIETCKVLKFLHDRNKIPCRTLCRLSKTTKSSLRYMIFHFHANLKNIISDLRLRQDLKRRFAR